MRVHRRVCNTGFNVYALEGLSRCSFRCEYFTLFLCLSLSFCLSDEAGRNFFLLFVCLPGERNALPVNDIGIMLSKPVRPSSVNDRFSFSDDIFSSNALPTPF